MKIDVSYPNKKTSAYKNIGAKETKIKVSGAYKKFKKTFKAKQKYKKNWIKVTVPKLKSGKKYYVRLKQRATTSLADDGGTKEDGESIWFGHKTIKVK
ncbi:hypothetical protein [Eubacterium xylanophilum]|uniref:hypothetical protein n=1 Tax=Eubacterium xylanophilum TaxID=39497 RepID=UPI00047BF100|nr:hypothetical protein [Eubacterium xylanophilum]